MAERRKKFTFFSLRFVPLVDIFSSLWIFSEFVWLDHSKMPLHVVRFPIWHFPLSIDEWGLAEAKALMLWFPSPLSTICIAWLRRNTDKYVVRAQAYWQLIASIPHTHTRNRIKRRENDEFAVFSRLRLVQFVNKYFGRVTKPRWIWTPFYFGWCNRACVWWLWLYAFFSILLRISNLFVVSMQIKKGSWAHSDECSSHRPFPRTAHKTLQQFLVPII